MPCPAWAVLGCPGSNGYPQKLHPIHAVLQLAAPGSYILSTLPLSEGGFGRMRQVNGPRMPARDGLHFLGR